jgi:hypothetical protein
MSSGIRFLCPVKICGRAFKSKSTWTRHLRSVHPLVNVQSQDIAIVALPSSPIRRHYGPIQVSPPTSPADDYDYASDPLLSNDVESFAVPEAVEEFLGTFGLLLFIQR